MNQVATPPPAPADDPPADPTGIGAAAGLIINGSVNNAATSPFAQPRAFGTNRPGQRSLYTYGAGLTLGDSSWDARPYSFSGTDAPKPSYTNANFQGNFQGPVKVPGLRNRVNFGASYTGSTDTNSFSQSSFVPTPLERTGNFSNSLDANGNPVQIRDPLTDQPFENNTIDPGRISPQAAALLAYYPLPNADGAYNYQQALITDTRTDAVNARAAYSLNNRNQIQGTVAYQRNNVKSTTLLGFEDTRTGSGFDTQLIWSFRLSQFLNLRTRYQLSQSSSTLVPFFAFRTNVSGDAGIAGNDQSPVNWGPPTLQFASDMAPLTDGRYSDSHTRTQTWASELQSFRGRHTLTMGGEYRRMTNDVVSQQDPRGAFNFTGAASGDDFADFLLGMPQTASLASGNADKYFSGNAYAAYLTDDWRVSPSFTMTLGVRWEYESPISEKNNRLVNLDVAPDFSSVVPVTADGVGEITGIEYSSALVEPDRVGAQPRLGIAWRPVPGSSLVVRAGYGIYRNTNVYQSIATQLAQQPPYSTSFDIGATENIPLRMSDAFVLGSAIGNLTTTNQFAVDPNLRVGYAQNWQASVQRDLPYSLTVNATYLGAKGSHLMQAFVPNTYPAGSPDVCALCPNSFRYVISEGRSIRHAGQVQLRRRLRSGFTATVQYTLAKSMDNAGSFAGATIDGQALAQNWLDLEAEYARSNFDQRHQVVASFEYTTGVGVAGGSLVDGWRGRLLKDWTFTSQLTTGSGTPLTPTYFSPLARTGIIGSTRPSLTGQPVEGVEDDSYANRNAFMIPAEGEWGNSPRNSITGPSQFSMNGSVARTFRMSERVSVDWRLDATNMLNRVVFTGVNTLITSPQFGLANRTSDMRKLRMSFRFRF